MAVVPNVLNATAGGERIEQSLIERDSKEASGLAGDGSTDLAEDSMSTRSS